MLRLYRTSDQVHMGYVTRYSYPGRGDGYACANWVNEGMDDWYQSDNTVGKLRITRVSGVMKAWHWDEGQSRWEWDNTTTGGALGTKTEDMTVGIYFRQGTGGAYVSARAFYFTVNSVDLFVCATSSSSSSSSVSSSSVSSSSSSLSSSSSSSSSSLSSSSSSLSSSSSSVSSSSVSSSSVSSSSVSSSSLSTSVAPEQQKFTVYSGTNDGYVYYDDADWATLRSAATGNEVNSTITNTAFAIMARHVGTYAISRSFFDFDLTALSDDIVHQLEDSYPSSNQNTQQFISGGWYNSVGQTFTTTTQAVGILTKATFYLRKVSSPTGNAVAELYATSGGAPTGSALATSDTFDVSTLTGSFALTDFIFNDSYNMSASTVYCICVTYTSGGGSDYLEIGTDSSPSHSGTGYRETGGWFSFSEDVIFYAYKDDGRKTIQSIALDLVGNSYNESNVMVQEGTQSASLGTDDFDSFTGSILAGPFDMELWVEADPARNLIYLDSTSYVVTNLGSSVKFCVREYDHDYSDSAPGDSSNYRNGVYYVETGYESILRTPRLIITYEKFPSWTPYFDSTSWDITNNATWDGDKYTSGSIDLVELEDVGVWTSGYNPYKMRITFTGATEIWTELKNTGANKNLIDGNEVLTSGQEVIIENYNNLDFDTLLIYNNGSGAFDVTNIEFLDP